MKSFRIIHIECLGQSLKNISYCKPVYLRIIHLHTAVVGVPRGGILQVSSPSYRQGDSVTLGFIT